MTDVVVVGSGVSGLYTAKGLLAKGLSVLVVEAADYVGGRVKQTNVWK
jgi:monoamine oxidase